MSCTSLVLAATISSGTRHGKTLDVVVATRRTGMHSGKHRVVPSEAALHARPVETRPWILLAARCHVLVAGDSANRVTLRNRGTEACRGFVLRVLEQAALKAFEFDADGEIVAVVAPLPLRCARMP